MKYVFLLYSDESIGKTWTPEEAQKVGQEFYALMSETKKAGVLVENNGLASIENATTVRVRDGKTMTTDGPFAETHEQFGGFFILECKDLDEAIAWAAKIPTAKYGSIEIRPQWDQ